MLKPLKHRLIAQIHIAKKQLCLDDETYRTALVAATGKSSCGNMNLDQLLKALKHFEDKGYKNNRRKSSPKTRQKPISTKTQQDKIRALWINMGKAGHIDEASEAALGAWVQRMTKKHNGIGYQSVDWVPEGLLTPLIEDLKRWQKRREKLL